MCAGENLISSVESANYFWWGLYRQVQLAEGPNRRKKQREGVYFWQASWKEGKVVSFSPTEEGYIGSLIGRPSDGAFLHILMIGYFLHRFNQTAER